MDHAKPEFLSANNNKKNESGRCSSFYLKR